MKLETKIKDLLQRGVYSQHSIFEVLYPSFTGHYSILRETIAKVKNDVTR